MSLHTIAMQYLRAGLSVLPARRDQKRPALSGWKDYQAKLPTEMEISAWFANVHDALCVVTGRVSGNLELIDFDNGGELFDRWATLVETESPGLMGKVVIEQSQSGGWHVVYHCTEAVCGNIHLAQRAVTTPDDLPIVLAGKSYKPRRNAIGQWEIVLTLIETRGEGGLFLCSPTPGYEIVQGAISEPPVLTAAEREILLEAAWSLNELIPSPVAVPIDVPTSAPMPGAERPGDAYNQRGDVVSLLKVHGWSLARDGENQYWRRPGKTQGWSATLKGRVFYVFSSNAAPFESGRAYGPFAVYTLLEHSGDYTRAASALRSQGYDAAPVTLPSAPVTDPPDEPLFMSVRQLVHDYPAMRKPVIHGMLRVGETMNLISAPKLGKSWLVIDLALSVVTGRTWLGQFQCERGDVLILDNELHPETLANRIPRVAEARQIGADQYADRLFVRNLRGRLKDIFSLGEYFQRLESGRFKLIICDAFYRFLPRDTDENDNGTMANLYNVVDHYADHTGSSFVLIHHSSKGNQSLKTITDVGAGAGSLGRAADAHIVIRRHEEDDVAVMEGETRAWPKFPPQCIKWSFPVWNPAPEFDPAQLRGDKPKKKDEEPPADTWTAEIFTQSFVADEPRSRSSILSAANTAGLSDYKAERLLRRAEASGLIHRWETGRNRPTSYARKPQPPESGEHS